MAESEQRGTGLVFFFSPQWQEGRCHERDIEHAGRQPTHCHENTHTQEDARNEAWQADICQAAGARACQLPATSYARVCLLHCHHGR